MKVRGWFAVAAVVLSALLVVATAQAQAVWPPVHYAGFGWWRPDFGGGLRYRHHASTAAEGYLRGSGDLIRAWGQYNLLTAEARRAYAAARHQEIVNRQEEVHAYFSLRDYNRRKRAANRRPRPTEEQLRRIAASARPRPLSPKHVDWITGRIQWPGVLLASHYEPFRAGLDRAFALRAAQGEIDPVTLAEAKRAAHQMLEELKSHIREMPSQEYMAARRFIESLAHDLVRSAR
ncbi:MAG TPA: hypothetical protein EYP56_12400 [Planctomycetaceae bacterium]|nr:hypothetical protein [Planctomycetaceae bacterium]HIQ22119.1 hypothetical protein [Planctomycetota bacterium]